MVRPKKHLGQHFLKDGNIADKIVGHLDAASGTVCELGPGTGILTDRLLDRKDISKLILVDIDAESIEFLESRYTDERLVIIEADFLSVSADTFGSGSLSLIGNFPYNISSQIFFKVLEHRQLFPEVVCMVQKEVAERIIAGPGSKTYGILSVLLQTWFDVTYCFTVSEGVFFPPPRVKSAVIRLAANGVSDLSCEEKLFFTVVKTAFGQRRKTLRNALRSLLPEDMLRMPVLDKRAEQLDKHQFEELARMIGQG